MSVSKGTDAAIQVLLCCKRWLHCSQRRDHACGLCLRWIFFYQSTNSTMCSHGNAAMAMQHMAMQQTDYSLGLVRQLDT